MSTVHVKLFATLRRHHPEVPMGGAIAAELPEGGTVAQVLAQLGVPLSEVRLVFVNGVCRGLDHVLSDQDDLGIFPPVGGG